MFGGGAFGELAFGEQDHVEGDDSAFRAFLARVRAPRCWLLEIDALSLAVSDAISAGFDEAGFSEAAFGGDDAGSSGGVQTLRYSTHGWTRRDYGVAEYLSLSGISGNYASTPDSAAVSVIGNIDIRCEVALDDWTPAAVQVLVAKWNSSNNSYLFRVASGGALAFFVSSNGTGNAGATSSVNPTVVDGAPLHLRVTWVAASGLVTFYTSADGVTWTQLGTTFNIAAGTTIFDGAAVLELGAQVAGTTNLLAGKIYSAEIRNGIDGTIVARFDPALEARPGDTSFTSSTTGEAWTVNQSGATPARLVAGDEEAYYYDGRLTGDFTVDRAIVGRDGIGGLSRVYSDVTLVNADGGLDALLRDYAIDGRAVRLLVGDVDAEYADFGTVFEGVVDSASISESIVRMRCSDGLSKLELPIQQTVYAGSGGLEGGADLAGKPKPLCYGVAQNITPPLVDAANLIYQVHDGAINDVSAVRDRGVALTRVTGAPAPGEYQPDLVNGTFTLGASPDGEITCDVEGDAPASGYTEHTGVIVQRILATRLSTSEIDTTAFANSFSALSAVVGIWVGPEIRFASEVIDELLAGAGAFGGFTRRGVFTIGQVAEASGAAVLDLDEADILAIEREPLPAPLEPVAWRVQVGWGKNYTVQTDVAALAADADRTFAAEPIRVAVNSDSSIQSQHLLARDYGPVPSLYRDEADAEAEAERLFGLWGTRRAQFRLQTHIEGMLADIGQVVQITHSRHLLNTGRPARVIAQSIRGPRVELRVIV